MAYRKFEFRYYGVQETAQNFAHLDAYTTQMQDMYRQRDPAPGSFHCVPSSFDSPLSELSTGAPSFTPPRVHTPSHAGETTFGTDGSSGYGTFHAVERSSSSDINHHGDDLSNFPTELIMREDSPYVPRDEPGEPRRSKRQRKTRKEIVAPSFDFADEQTEIKFEDDEGDATEDEYLPKSPSANTLKRARSASLEAGPSSRPTDKRPRVKGTRKPRNTKKTCSKVDVRGKRFKCGQCSQTFSKSQDVTRHAKKEHLGIRFPCCGVPYEERMDYELFYDTIITMDDGTLWIGGCGTVYSRQDALLRHLRERKGRKCMTLPDYKRRR